MEVYVVRDSAGNIRGVTSTAPSIPASNFYEVFTLDRCLNCGQEHFSALDDENCEE